MERNFNNVDFEELIKDSADQYRMYPSEKAWKGIYNALHTSRRWFGLGFVFLLLASGLVTVFIVSSKKTNLKEIALSGQSVTSTNPHRSQPSIQTDYTASLKNNTTSTPVNTNNDPNTEDVSIITKNTFVPKTTILQIENNMPQIFNEAAEQVIAEADQPFISHLTDQATDETEYVTGFEKNIIIANQPESKLSDKLLTLPWSIESVVNLYQKARKRNKITYQVYFTPTISYRKLSENKSFLQSAPTNVPFSYAALYDINNAVTHKPDMGLELGFSGKYPLTKNIKVRAGLQFNISRYEIKAFNYPIEVTTIALNSGYNRVEAVNTISNYRNFNGGKADWLKNFYFQASLPVGAEVKLAGDDKIQFGVASTIQPTYILGDRAYLISTDYKNYAEVPWLIRRWNVNTNVETFVAYSTGRLNWQVGPQVRYQLLSSFVNKYPVKENLFDFGLKVGVGLNK